jgi:hypothetical protein
MNKKATHNKYYEQCNAVNPEPAITKSLDKFDIMCNFLKCMRKYFSAKNK